CLAVQFYSGYQLDNSVSLERINEWNSGDRRFIRAYLTDDGAARIEMDVATSADGISERDFNDLLSLWIDRMEEFETFIGW
ncbi:MAG: YbjN domain-containing protein, partial [Maritimibacter sp.]